MFRSSIEFQHFNLFISDLGKVIQWKILKFHDASFPLRTKEQKRNSTDIFPSSDNKITFSNEKYPREYFVINQKKGKQFNKLTFARYDRLEKFRNEETEQRERKRRKKGRRSGKKSKNERRKSSPTPRFYHLDDKTSPFPLFDSRVNLALMSFIRFEAHHESQFSR